MGNIKINHWTTMVVWCLAMWNQSTLGYNITDVGRLKEYVREKYDASIRPIVNQSEPIQVSINFAITNLIQIDMMNGQLEAVGYILGVWKDESISWNGTQFDDIPRLALQDGDVWSPDITQLAAIGEEVERISLVIQKDGTVFWGVSRRFTTFCTLNMRYYPRDEHVCTFEFVSSRYPTSELRLEPSFDGVDLAGMRPHGELIVRGSSVRKLTKYVFGLEVQGISYSIEFGRQPDFISLHQTVPLALLVISNLFVHVVPLNSGERISYAVTVLLAFVFWQAIVVEGLPPNSSKLSILSMIMTLCIAVSTASTILSVILCRVADCGEDRPVPTALVRLAKRLRWNRHAYALKPKHGSKKSQQNANNVDVNNGGCADTEDGDVTPESDDNEVTWLEAANAIDLLALIVFIIVALGAIVGFTTAYLV